MSKIMEFFKNNKGEKISARELYLAMELDRTKWSRWNKSNIIDSGYIEDVDYFRDLKKVKGNYILDFIISEKMAVEIVLSCINLEARLYKADATDIILQYMHK